MTTNEVIAQETVRLQHILNRDPTGLEVTMAIIGYDEAAEAGVIQALTRRGVYQATVFLEVGDATGHPGLTLELDQDYYYGADNEAAVAKQLAERELRDRVRALAEWAASQRTAVDPTPTPRRAARLLE